MALNRFTEMAAKAILDKGMDSFAEVLVSIYAMVSNLDLQDQSPANMAKLSVGLIGKTEEELKYLETAGLLERLLIVQAMVTNTIRAVQNA